MKNTLVDLNNYLFEALERLNDDSQSDEELDREIRKADAIVKVSEKIIDTGELAFRAIQHKDKYYGSQNKHLPQMLDVDMEKDWKG